MTKRSLNVLMICGGAGMLSLSASADRTLPAAQVSGNVIVLREHVGQDWTRQTVCYALEAADGAYRPEALRLRGPDGDVAVQLSDVKLWPGDTFVQSAFLHFVVDRLDPLSDLRYTLIPGGGAVPDTGLRVVKQDAAVEVSVQGHALRLLLGSKTYDTPASPAEVPGPLLAVRGADGTWAGGSALHGETRVVSYASRLTDEGPVFARVATTYVYEDGTSLELTVTLHGGDNGSRWAMRFDGDRPDEGLKLDFGSFPGITEAFLPAFPRGFSHWPRSDRAVPLGTPPLTVSALMTEMTIAGWFPQFSPAVTLRDGDQNVHLHLYARHPGAWVDPVPFTYPNDQASWNIDMIVAMWEAWQRKEMPVEFAAGDQVGMRISLVQGGRQWGVSHGSPLLGERLDTVKNYVLDWDEQPRARPDLFMSQAETLEALGLSGGNARDMGYIRAIDQHLSSATSCYPGSEWTGRNKPPYEEVLPQGLAALGFYDTKRNAIALMAHYDALIDTEAYRPEQRRLMKAQMAYLAHFLWEPASWSMERGYITGNPNMSVAYAATIGIAACLLPDHPMAPVWADYATGWMLKFLDDEVSADGVWVNEGSHYKLVSVRGILAYAVAAKRAGYVDLFENETLKRLGLFLVKTQIPNDAGFKRRVTAPFGRGTAVESTSVFGILARETRESDPEYSAMMQWMWAQNRFIDSPLNNETRMGGLEPLYLRRRDLPQRAPVFESALMAGLGALFRHGYGTDNESYLLLHSDTGSRRNIDVYVSNIGSIAGWWHRRRQVASVFYHDNMAGHHELLRDGVMLARNYPAEPRGPFGYYTTHEQEVFNALPVADYSRSTSEITEPDPRGWFPPNMPEWPKVTAATEARLIWTRQVMFLRDTDPAGAAYLVLLDTTSGGQPTIWQFRSASEKIGTPAEVVDVEAFLADKPGQHPAPARPLSGNRLTAIGQQDVDLEFYIVEPIDTPRHTLRWGGGGHGIHGGLGNYDVYRDILHLQRAGDGAYFVVAFPRMRDEAVPSFETLGAGRIIKIKGGFGTDYAFLSHEPASARGGDATFEGTAASVQDRGETVFLNLSAPGKVAYGSYTLTATEPVSLRAGKDSLELTFAAGNAACNVQVITPGTWVLRTPAKAELVQTRAGIALQVGQDAGTLELQRR